MTIAERLNTTPNDLLGFITPEEKQGIIKTGDIKGNTAPVVVGSHNTVVAPPSSSSSSTAKKKGKRK